MRYVTASAALLFCMVSLPGAALARCNLSVDAPGQVRFRGGGGGAYEGFAVARYETEFDVTVTNAGSEPCNGLLSVQRIESSENLNGPAGRGLAYRISRPGNQDTLVENQREVGRPRNAIAITVPPGQTRTQRLAMQVQPQQFVPSGAYQKAVLVRVLDATDLQLSAERSVELVATVEPAMSIMLYDSGISPTVATGGGTRNYRLDFDKLETGEQGAVTVLVQSNDDYQLRFSSSHGGALWHAVRGAAERIQYSATFGGQALNLSTGDALISGAGGTGPDGSALPLNIRIGTVGAARAGRYEDQITITVLPLG